MGKLTFIFLSCIFFTARVAAFADTSLQLHLQKTIEGNFKNFYADNFGNLFLINANNQIKKLNENFDSAAVFNDVRRYGDIDALDVNNPLKILVYYKDFATLVILDRFLNIRNTIDLRQNNILQASAAAQSYDNNYWIFDEVENRLKKIDENGKLLQQSPDFRLLFDETFIPAVIIDRDGQLFLYNEIKGWMIFDYYGAYKQRVDMNAWEDVDAANKILTGRIAADFFVYNTATLSLQKISVNIDMTTAKKMVQQKNKFYLLNNAGLHIYSAQ